jgi:hypothetical protein
LDTRIELKMPVRTIKLTSPGLSSWLVGCCVLLCCVFTGCNQDPGTGQHWTREVEVNKGTIAPLYSEQPESADTIFFNEVRLGKPRKFRQSRGLTVDEMNCEDHLVLTGTLKLNLIMDPNAVKDYRATIRKKVLTAYKCYADASTGNSGLSPGIITFPTHIVSNCQTDSLIEFIVFRTDGDYIAEINP